MHDLLWSTALLAGFFGSGHCAAMCGGIATALGAVPARAASAWNNLLYQAGRIASYALAGGLAGALGSAAGIGFEPATWSRVLRLGTACMVVMIGLNMTLGAGARPGWLRTPERWGAMLWRRIAPGARARLPAHPAARALVLGLLWGWLPCGLVYSTLLAAAVSGSAPAGAVTLIAFGLGTLPAMASLSVLGARAMPHGPGFARIAGALLVACGIWTAAMPIAMLGGAGPHSHAQPHSQPLLHAHPAAHAHMSMHF